MDALFESHRISVFCNHLFALHNHRFDLCVEALAAKPQKSASTTNSNCAVSIYRVGCRAQRIFLATLGRHLDSLLVLESPHVASELDLTQKLKQHQPKDSKVFF